MYSLYAVKQMCSAFFLPFYFCFAVLVALYEETDKPNNALEYPFLMCADLYKLFCGNEKVSVPEVIILDYKIMCFYEDKQLFSLSAGKSDKKYFDKIECCPLINLPEMPDLFGHAFFKDTVYLKAVLPFC